MIFQKKSGSNLKKIILIKLILPFLKIKQFTNFYMKDITPLKNKTLNYLMKLHLMKKLD